MDTYSPDQFDLNRPSTPWVQYEDITIAASEITKRSSPSYWVNGTDDLLLIDYFTFDMNSLGFLVNFGVTGRVPIIKDHVAPAVLENVLKMNQAADNSYPLLKFDPAFPYLIPPRENIQVLLKDTLSGGARVVNVAMVGLNEKDDYSYMTTRVTVPNGGSIGATLQSKENGELRVVNFQLYEESAGSSGDLRGLEVWVKGAGVRYWTRGYIRGSLLFPQRNADGLAYRLPQKLVLLPGDVLDFEFLDKGGSGGTMYLGAIGYAFDLRG